ncbi:MAG: PAS domain S-box protein [Ignavibacteriaceae bacterium]|nr:PAS domain S-box protein [Ignavibacteriaceae bacterium]
MNKIVTDRFFDITGRFLTGSPLFGVLFNEEFDIIVYNTPDDLKYGFTEGISNLRQVLTPSSINFISELAGTAAGTLPGKFPVIRELKFLNGCTSEFLITLSASGNLREAGSKFLLILVSREEKGETDPSELDYPELFRIIKDDTVTELVDSVLSSYPFTMLGKIRFQDHISALDYGILLTDADDKIIAINKIFAPLLGGDSPKAIEGKKPDDINGGLQAGSSELSTVLKSKSAMQVRVNSESGELTVFAVPIRDYKKDFVARLIFSSKEDIIEIKKKGSLSVVPLINHFNLPALILDAKGNIREKTPAFSEKFGNIKNNSIYGILISDDSKIDFNSFITSDSCFSRFKLDSEPDAGTELYLVKIFSEPDDFVILLIAEEFRQTEETLEEILKNKGPMYQIIIQNNPEPVFVYDTENLRFLDVNEKALQLYGYTRNEFLNLDVTDLYSPEDIQTILESSNLSEGYFTGPYRHRKKDGKIINVEIAKSSFTYEGKEAHFNIVKDISKRLEKDFQLQIYQSMFEASDNLCFILDMTGFITHVNPVVETVLGYSRSEMLGNNIVSFVEDEFRSFFTKRNLPEIKEKVIFKSVNGEPKECSTVLTLYYDIDGNLDSMSVVASPAPRTIEVVVEKPVEKIITKEVVVEKEVPARAGNHGLPSSLGIDPEQMKFVFHEILSPFNVIVGFLSEVKDSIISPSEEQKEAFSYIDENKAKLLYTMDSISEYAIIEKEMTKTADTAVSLKEVIGSIKSDYESANNPYRKGLEITRITEFVSLQTDKEKFRSLLYLFIKLASNLTTEARIYFSAYEYDSNNIVITLKDDLAGITNKFNENLKTLFNFNDVLTLRAHDLSRFSLAAFRKLYESVNGRIETISKNGSPLEFGLVIPLKAHFKVDEASPVRKPELPGMDSFSPFNEKEEPEVFSKTETRFKSPFVSDEELGKKYGFSSEEDEDRFFKDTLGYSTEFEKSFEESLREREKKYTESEKKPEPEPDRFDFTPFERGSKSSEPPVFSEDTVSGSEIKPQGFNTDLFKTDKPKAKIEETPPAPPRETRKPAEEEIKTPPRSEFDFGLSRGFEMPRKPEADDSILKPKTPVPPSEPKDFRAPSEPQAKGGFNLANLSCLYIEDQLDSQILFKVQMKDLKEIKFAQSFEDAEPLLDDLYFDFIVMDINLQGEYNGLDALKMIRTMPKFEKTPIIAVTAYVLPGDKDKFIALGFDDFISKPIFKNKMTEVLEKIF